MTRFLILMAIFPYIILFEGICFASEPQIWDKKINFRPPNKIWSGFRSGPGFETRLDSFQWVKGNLFVFGAAIRPGMPNKWQPNYDWICFPPLQKGDILPIYGYMYRVTDLDNGLEVSWIPEKFLPPNIKMDPTSITIPLRYMDSGGAIKKERCQHSLEKIQVLILEGVIPSEKENESPVAQLVTGWHMGNPHMRTKVERININELIAAQKKATAQIRINDVVVMDQQGEEIFKKEKKREPRGHLVRSIVPRQPAKGIIGWIELDPTPIVGAELEKHPRLVRPQPESERR